MQSTPQFCDNCGAVNRAHARFCSYCGNSFVAVAVEASVPTASARVLAGRYSIMKPIGSGGMGSVYLAEDQRFLGALRAIKELSQTNLSPQDLQEATQAFEQEALMLARLSHPNLPRIYDHFQEVSDPGKPDGHWYLVMDYVEGQTLESLQAQKPDKRLDIADVVNIGQQLCSVLQYLHTQTPPIIFRDLKPANVMVTHEKHVYLIDFGIARLFKPGQLRDTMILGSPGYAAPEQYGKAQTTARTDLYSLGATLHVLLTGHDPSTSPFKFPPIQPTTPGIDELDKLIQQLVKIDPDGRPQDAEQVRLALLQISQKLFTLSSGTLNPLPPTLPAVTPVSSTIPSNSQPPEVVAPEVPIAQAPVLDPVYVEMNLTPIQFPAYPTASSLPPITPGLEIIVDQSGRERFRTIGEAVQAALPQTKIIVRPGIYNECIVIDKPLMIVGDGSNEQVILEGQDTHTLVLRADQAIIQDLTIRCKSGTDPLKNAVRVPRGTLTLERCRISSTSGPSLRVLGVTSYVIVRDCTLSENTNEAAILFHHSSQGEIDNCDIFSNYKMGIAASDRGTRVWVHKTRVYDNTSNGVYAYEQGEIIVEDCDLFGNTFPALASADPGSLLVVRQSRIHDSTSKAVWCGREGKMLLEDCSFSKLDQTNIYIEDKCLVEMHRCNLSHGKSNSIYGETGASLILEGCRFQYFEHSTYLIDGCQFIMRDCRWQDQDGNGVQIKKNCRGILERCDLSYSGYPLIWIDGGSEVNVRDCHIHHGESSGISVKEASPIIDNCDIHHNGYSGIIVEQGAGNPLVQHCQIHDNLRWGVYGDEYSRGTIENTRFANNAKGAWYLEPSSKTNFNNNDTEDDLDVPTP